MSKVRSYINANMNTKAPHPGLTKVSPKPPGAKRRALSCDAIPSLLTHVKRITQASPRTHDGGLLAVLTGTSVQALARGVRKLHRRHPRELFLKASDRTAVSVTRGAIE